MIDRIRKALEKEGIAVWRVMKTREQRAELYFIKKELDMPRYADITLYSVDVFRDFEEDGIQYRGFTTANVEPGMTDEEIGRKVREAYFAANFVKNPYFELPDAVCEEKKASPSDLKGRDLRETAAAFAAAVFEVPSDENAFVNSLEIFAERFEKEIVASNGLHVAFDSDRVRGEFVAQCRTPVDVEQFRAFSYDSFDVGAIRQKIAEGIADVKLRAAAKGAPKSGKVNVILKGEQLREFLSYYVYRSMSSIIYPQYSDWKAGDRVQKETEGGEALNLRLAATVPYSDEGIPMKDRVLLQDGVLKTVHGGNRFCRYLNVEPTGNYEKISCGNGTVPFEEMKSGTVLECISFSDFQTDFFSGNFGGEMRLSILHENGEETPLSGGSINGKLSDAEGRLIFSKERYEDSHYEGPYAVLIPDVPVAGL